MIKDVLHALLFFALYYVITFLLWFLNFMDFLYITTIIFAVIVGMAEIDWRWLKVSLFAILTSLNTCLGLYWAAAGVLQKSKSKSTDLYNHFLKQYLWQCVDITWKNVGIIFIVAGIGYFLKKKWREKRKKEP